MYKFGLITITCSTKTTKKKLENFHEPVEFRVSAFNRYGSLPPNTHGYIIRLNEPILQRETPFINRRVMIIIASIFGGTIFLFFLCCLCGACNRDQTKLVHKDDYNHATKYPHSSTESEALKPSTDDTIAHLVANGNDKRLHQNGTVYDTPAQLINDKYSHPTSAYHQQKLQQYTDRDSSTSSVNSIPIRTRTVNNKFYDHPIIDNKYGPLSPTTMVVPTIKNDEEEGNESPVYSTTTDVLSESGSFLVPTSSSSKRYVPPPPKPRYSTLSSLRLPIENLDKSPLPLPKPRSRSNSRTRLNNPNSDNSSFLYEERPVSSTDSGMGQSDVVCLPNGDTIRSGLVKSRQNSLQKHYITPSSIQQQTRYQTLTSPIVHGTEC